MRATIRAAGAQDWEHLARLRFQWRTEEGNERGEWEGFSHSFHLWYEDHRESHRAFLADLPGEPGVGMAWVAVIERVPGPSKWERLSGLVQSVYVRPVHRGQGIGEELVRAGVQWAIERGLDYLIVHPREQSRSLYERVGFAVTDRVMELRFAGG